MSNRHTTAQTKPSKPYPEFPLFPHATRRWAKKIRGKMHYFGPWDDPDGALEKYNEQKDALHEGRKPRPDQTGITVKDVANAWLNHKDDKVKASELSPRTRAKYQDVAVLVVKQFGKSRVVADLGPDDFAALKNRMARKWGALRVRDVIQHVRSIFKYAFDTELIDRPIRFGPGFARPSNKTLRLERARRGSRLFTPPQIRALIRQTSVPMRAMILLGINAGFGNADCSTLPLASVNLAAGWIDYPRPKTGLPRRCPLWPETVAALRAAIAERPEPKGDTDAGLVFVTKYGGSWHKAIDDSPVCKEMAKLLRKLKLNHKRGLTFYALRHCFETIGGEAKDQVAVDHIMGHARDAMASVYREKISDDRLRAVTDRVRAWLFTDTAAGQRPTGC
jgi:integrase